MTVKINDLKMLDAYKMVIRHDFNFCLSDKIQYFIGTYSINDETSIKEYQMVISALLNDEDVELYPQKYRIKLKGLVDSYGQQYVTRLKNGDSYFACGEKKNSVVIDKLIQEFTKDEVDYIMKSVIEGIVEEVK